MIMEEGSFSAQEGEGSPQNNVPPYGGISAPPRHYIGVPMQAWESGAAMRPPTHFALPNVAFANKMHTFLNHNKV
jgi:hypothetical protein